MAGDRRAVDDAGGRREWALSVKDRGCMCCGRPEPDWRGWQVHHLMPGRCGRSDEPANYLFVCAVCHDLCEKRQIRNPKTGQLLETIPLGMALTVKLIRNFEDWDRERLKILHGTRLPELAPLPAWMENEYRRNHPVPFRPWREEHFAILASVNDWINSYEVSR